jgi:ribosome biogenesis GTPase / thiamine phosphate phosphatase
MNPDLRRLGVSSFFTQQLSLEEYESCRLARIIEIQRSHVVASDGGDNYSITLGGAWFKGDPEQRPTVGDWVLLDNRGQKIIRLLERKSVFKRVTAGNKSDIQLIAANIDTLFIVTSCNEEFSESRLERYLAVALEAGVDPVVILTKADLCDNSEHYQHRVEAMRSNIPVVEVNATDIDSLDGIRNWLSFGSTVALVGSSGVGKSTLVNSLSDENRTQTGNIRQQDAKGRHTTSFRSLHRLPEGGILLDVPGIRELKVAHLESSLDTVFDDIDSIAEQCKYANCVHNDEPGCAVRTAIDEGRLDPRRLSNFKKLALEEARNTASLAQQRMRERKFSKAAKRHVALKQKSGKLK